ncbi:tetratricopeptide repeat protein [Marinoscillum pacificum]|uniref:tetratricopeptide repeat protein n=1 Tax=Marinoscillum pacificum TaxID=392723 RepID=UPI002157755B|nr:tetratricopeptide repeat protein [Marinoscillum pacificum]
MVSIYKYLIGTFLCFAFFSIYGQASSSIDQKLSEVDSLLDLDSTRLAKVALDQINDHRSSTFNIDQLIFFHKLSGDYYLMINNYESSEQAYAPLLNISSNDLSKESTIRLARAINDMGISQMKIGRHEEAKQNHFRSIILYDRYNDHQGAAFNYNNLALLYQEAKNIDSALISYELSLQHAQIANDTLGIAYNHRNLASLYADNQEPIKAFEHFQEAMRVAVMANNESILNSTKLNLARYYNRLHDYEGALNLFHHLKMFYNRDDWPATLGMVYIGMAESFMGLHQQDSALHYLNQSIEVLTPTNYKKGLSQAHNMIGMYYLDTKEYDLALTYFDKALQIATTLKGTQWINLRGKAQVYLELGEYQKAIDYASESMDSPLFSESVNNLATRYEILYKGYKALNNKDLALHYLELMNEQKAKLFSEDKALDIARLEYRNELTLEELRRAELEKELKYERMEDKRNQQIIQLILIIAVIIVSTISLLINHSKNLKSKANRLLKERNEALHALRNKEKQISEQTIATKDRALAAATMSQHEKNNILSILNDKIANLSSEDDLKSTVKELRKTIGDSYSLDKSWDSFVHRFEDVHPGFFESLKKKSTAITINDLKLSAYIKIGMSNKEIANVTHLTLGSVKSKINRLKKKLELSSEENIREYLLQL